VIMTVIVDCELESVISIAMGGGVEVAGRGLDLEIRAYPMRSVNTVGGEYGRD